MWLLLKHYTITLINTQQH